MKTNLIPEIISSLRQLADPKRKEMSGWYYPTTSEVLGLTNPNIKSVLAEVKKQTKSWTPRQIIELAIDLVQTNIFECQHMAYEMLGKDQKTMKSITEADIDAMNRNLDNWVSVDTFGCYVVGFAFRENIISLQKIRDYYASENFWYRRLAVVASVALNQKSRGGKGDPKRTLAICEWAVADHQDMVVKALSWALRELSKVEKEPVEDFIKKHRDKLHKRVLREVGTKLATGKKYVKGN